MGWVGLVCRSGRILSRRKAAWNEDGDNRISDHDLFNRGTGRRTEAVTAPGQGLHEWARLRREARAMSACREKEK
jgi:hypothetical protein